MASEYERLDIAIADIKNADTDRLAIEIATTALGKLLLDILEELRDKSDA